MHAWHWLLCVAILTATCKKGSHDRPHTQVYAGVRMTIRMVAGDAVDGTDSYGLSSLGQTFDSTGRGQNSGGISTQPVVQAMCNHMKCDIVVLNMYIYI